MMRIAMLGATSQVGRDFIQGCVRNKSEAQLFLFTRSHEKLKAWLGKSHQALAWSVMPLELFGQHHYDVVINLIGSGNPKQTRSLGRSIVEITDLYDSVVVSYLHTNSNCRYIYFSSGAVYRDTVDGSITTESELKDQSESESQEDWYALSKLRCEARHRAHEQMEILDVRLFSYFSASQNPMASFLLSDIMRALYTGSSLLTTPTDIYRDYLGPEDMYALIWNAISTETTNMAIDTYSLSPVSKLQILSRFTSLFGLRIDWLGQDSQQTITMAKKNYYSMNRLASHIGFRPGYSSMEMLESEMLIFFKQIAHFRNRKSYLSDLSEWMALAS